MKNISTDSLLASFDRGNNTLLIDLSLPDVFRGQHIPGAVNAPANAPGFDERVVALATQHKKSRIVVYGFDATPEDVARAARALAGAGHKDVRHFAAGLAGYVSAGMLPIASR
ncbi:MAG: rhodanese-related sulfurtransferase [Planctomycetota bacterium]|jgi:rhodanese-related sulfurtransferase